MTRSLVRTAGLTLGAAVLAFVLPCGAAQSQMADQPQLVTSQELHAKVAKTKDGLATYWLPTGPGNTVVVAHREQPGHAEVHMALNDEFVAQEGRASVLVGGRVEGNTETAPGEWRGGTIIGGKTYAMAPGDVLWIPAGMPHQIIVPKHGSFLYLAFKFPRKVEGR